MPFNPQAVRLRNSVRESDTVARMGGDEFAIIQPFIDQPEAASRLAERLIALIGRPFEIEGGRCTVGISIGIAVYPDDAGTTSKLLINADKALYRAKAQGRGRVEVFGAPAKPRPDPEATAPVPARLEARPPIVRPAAIIDKA